MDLHTALTVAEGSSSAERRAAAIAVIRAELARLTSEHEELWTCGCPAQLVRDAGHQEGCQVQIMESAARVRGSLAGDIARLWAALPAAETERVDPGVVEALDRLAAAYGAGS